MSPELAEFDINALNLAPSKTSDDLVPPVSKGKGKERAGETAQPNAGSFIVEMMNEMRNQILKDVSDLFTEMREAEKEVGPEKSPFTRQTRGTKRGNAHLREPPVSSAKRAKNRLRRIRNFGSVWDYKVDNRIRRVFVLFYMTATQRRPFPAAQCCGKPYINESFSPPVQAGENGNLPAQAEPPVNNHLPYSQLRTSKISLHYLSCPAVQVKGAQAHPIVPPASNIDQVIALPGVSSDQSTSCTPAHIFSLCRASYEM
ncbi:hypothetical protein K458DRAFT_449111 [Lentithecium fluviatile CBS 122367]|uniref:Uncharacterized protein n=1 Tax=Lentithecium fluviatile CBS 122367 TaxID=1168545 RepID=A0A6G1JP47_9PLEO|nr:hypothetical protein K458DRAFT_449111 [Lentithecium fluviatile CBS 122367]